MPEMRKMTRKESKHLDRLLDDEKIERDAKALEVTDPAQIPHVKSYLSPDEEHTRLRRKHGGLTLDEIVGE